MLTLALGTCMQLAVSRDALTSSRGPDNMACGSMMKAPICLVENQKYQLTVNRKALEILDKITQPVVVVAIAGLYRTGKSYLMNHLAGQNYDEGSQIQNNNKIRECIRKFFPKRKCFVFDRPTNDKKLLRLLHEASETQLETTFQEQSKNFCSYVFKNAEAKTLRQGIIVNGNRLGTLVVTYVDAINSGAVPCLENAVTTLAQRENSAAVQEAAAHYSEQMAQRVTFPTDTLQELLDLHAACEREAIEIFMEHSFKDENQEFQKKLVSTIQEKKEDFLLQNEEASRKYCEAQLTQLLEPLRNDISGVTFSVPGGYELYLEERHKVEQSYKLVPRKGVKANEVLQNFLQSLAATEESILQADSALTAAEKNLAAEHAKNQALQKELELQDQKLKEQQEKMEAHEKACKENIVQLKKKVEEEREIQLREQEEILEHKLKMQKELLDEGFKEKSEEMEKEISQLKEEIKTLKNNRRSFREIVLKDIPAFFRRIFKITIKMPIWI
nr:PREDICTED: guanylate-binding protein 4-like [Rhinolophus sinicus]